MLIIHSKGGYENMVPIKAMKEFQLKTDNHSKPCKITWLKQDNKVIMDKQCIVSFSIGKKNDKAWYDVFSMHVCHILLDKPSQCDKKVMYDQWSNTNTLSIKGDCVILASRRVVIEVEPSKNKNLVSLSQYMDKIKNKRVFFLCWRI